MRLAVVGEREIAERLQVQPATVHQWRRRGRLPPAEASVSGMPVWRWTTIERWAHATGRLRSPRPPWPREG